MPYMYKWTKCNPYLLTTEWWDTNAELNWRNSNLCDDIRYAVSRTNCGGSCLLLSSSIPLHGDDELEMLMHKVAYEAMRYTNASSEVIELLEYLEQFLN